MGWLSGPPPEPRLVRLHLLNGAPSIEGVLLDEQAGHYRLANPTVVDPDEPVEMSGEAWVPRERVLFVQVLS